MKGRVGSGSVYLQNQAIRKRLRIMRWILAVFAVATAIMIGVIRIGYRDATAYILFGIFIVITVIVWALTVRTRRMLR